MRTSLEHFRTILLPPASGGLLDAVKERVQISDKSLQEFAAAVEQLTHRVLVGLPVAFIQTEPYHAFIDGVRDQKVKQHLLMGGDCDPK